MEVLKRNLDGMAAVKLNVFHWHLTENQGFRIESKKFPKLHQLGSDGLYYTQDQAREIVTYAADRGIRVVPEFDMPGHSTAWLIGMADLSGNRRLAAARERAVGVYRSRRVRKYLLIAAIAVAVFGLLGFFAAPPIIRSQIEARANALLSGRAWVGVP